MPAPSPPHTPLRLSPRRELRLRNLRLRPGGKETRWERAEGKGAVAGWVRARPAPARVPAFQETWKPKIKVRRDRCPEPGAWVPGWALSLGRQGGDPAGADAAPRRNPGSEPQPRTSDFSGLPPPPEAKHRPALPCPGRLAEPEPPAPREAAGPCPFLEAARRRSERARWPRRAGGLCPLTGTEKRPAPGLAASHGEGAGPTQSSKRLIRAACPTE